MKRKIQIKELLYTTIEFISEASIVRKFFSSE